MRRRIVAGLVAATSLVGAPVATAGEDYFHTGSLASGARDAGPSAYYYRATAASADTSWHSIQVAAHFPGTWDIYGSYIIADGYACHAYSGDRQLGGLIRNPESFTQDPVIAKYRWGTSYAC